MKKLIDQVPEWSRRILALRADLNLTQASLALRLDYSAMALSRWERGTHEPTAQSYIRLGNLAGKSQCWWFWEQAGFDRRNLSRTFPQRPRLGLDGKLSQLEILASPKIRNLKTPVRSRLVVIPVLAAYAATQGSQGDLVMDISAVAVQEVLAAPEAWCPTP